MHNQPTYNRHTVTTVDEAGDGYHGVALTITVVTWRASHVRALDPLTRGDAYVTIPSTDEPDCPAISRAPKASPIPFAWRVLDADLIESNRDPSNHFHKDRLTTSHHVDRIRE
jgi:hypothetical protein